MADEDSRNVFKLLWRMVNDIEQADTYRGRSQTGTIISRYAGMIDDRIENSGYSRSTDSLSFYTVKQLKEEIQRRKEEE